MIIPLEPTSAKKQIKELIEIFYSRKKHGYEFHGKELFQYVFDRGFRNVYPDTIGRYMRELRSSGKLNYSSVGIKSESLYRVEEMRKN